MAMHMTPETSMPPAELAQRLAAGEALTVLDIREDAAGTIEAPSAKLLHRGRPPPC